jgi:predicted O-methyltransferase YrrM
MMRLVAKVLLSVRSLIRNEQPNHFKKFDTGLLDQADDAKLQKLRKAMKFVATESTWSVEELGLLKMIDAIRSACANLDEEVIIRDFGAGDSQKRTTAVMEQGVETRVTIGDTVRIGATPAKWGKLLFRIVRDFKFQYCLELGTHIGISAAYQLAALKLNGSGRLVTIEGAEAFAKLAKDNLATIGYPEFEVLTGRFIDVLPKIFTTEQSIDFAFIDGHHDETATQQYFELIYPFLSTNALLIFDDIDWSTGMQRAWRTISHDKKIKASIDTGRWGICFIDKTTISKQLHNYKIAIW